MPRDIFITHICLYAVAPKYCHLAHLWYTPSVCQTEYAQQMADQLSVLVQSDKFEANSELLRLQAIKSSDTEEGRNKKPVIRSLNRNEIANTQ